MCQGNVDHGHSMTIGVNPLHFSSNTILIVVCIYLCSGAEGISSPSNGEGFRKSASIGRSDEDGTVRRPHSTGDDLVLQRN